MVQQDIPSSFISLAPGRFIKLMGRLGRGEQSVWEEQNASELYIQVPISEAERL